MNKKVILPIVLATILLVALFLFPKPAFEYQKIEGHIQGTTYHITYKYKKNKDLHPEIEKILHDFDMSLSTYVPNSIISRINQNQPGVIVDDLFKEVFLAAQKVHLKSDGAFDITVAPLVNAWGFGFTPGAKVDSALIDSLLQFVGMDKVSLNGSEVVKSSPGVMLDVNAIAQGFSVDVVCQFFNKKGVSDYLVEIGGELRAVGVNGKGENWKIGIDRPVDGNNVAGTNLQAVVSVSGKSLATSGNYRKFYEKDGVKYAHSIDPKTGYPVLSRLLSATVVTSDCMTADAYATVFMVAGLDKTLKLLKTLPELDAYLIYSSPEGNYEVFATEGMRKIIVEEAQ